MRICRRNLNVVGSKVKSPFPTPGPDEPTISGPRLRRESAFDRPTPRRQHAARLYRPRRRVGRRADVGRHLRHDHDPSGSVEHRAERADRLHRSGHRRFLDGRDDVR